MRRGFKKLVQHLCILVLFCISLSAAQQVHFVVQIESDPIAASYEIQWLQSPNDLEELSREEVITLKGAHIELDAPLAPWFRLRARNAQGYAGQWSEVFTSADFMKGSEASSIVLAEKKDEIKPLAQMEFITTKQNSYLKDGLIRLTPIENEKAFYTIDGKNEQPYEGEISLEHGREYTLKVSYRDMDNKTIREDTYHFIVDLVPPVTRRFIFYPAERKGHLLATTNSYIEFRAKDGDSGVKATFCRLRNDDPFVKCEGNINFKTLVDVVDCDDCLTLEYYSVDKAGNQEAIKTEKLGFIL